MWEHQAVGIKLVSAVGHNPLLKVEPPADRRRAQRKVLCTVRVAQDRRGDLES